MRFIRQWIWVIAAAACGIAQAVTFSGTPQITQAGDSVRIEFTISENTDVTVSINDSAGNVVRHLAAGLLGANPPLPLQPNTLSQTLYWDHRTDQGTRFDGTCEVVVGLGLAPKLDRTYGWDPQNQYALADGLIGVAVDKDGHVVTLHPNRMLLYNADGSYIRTLSPYPGDLPENQVAGYGRVSLPNGKGMPVVYQGHTGVVLPEMEGSHRQGIAVSPQGWIVFSNEVWGSVPYGNANEWGGNQAGCRRTLITAPDGSCPRPSVFGPVIFNACDGGHLFLAVSPGGRYLYASGLRQGMLASLSTPAGHNVVYRALLDSRDTAGLFYGQEGVGGTDSAHFNDPRGVAVDANGNVYVADYGNQRIMVLDSNGVYLKQLRIVGADQVQVNRTTGHVFVLSLESTIYRIRKLGPLPALDSMAVFSDSYSGRPPVMALDDHGSPARIWVGPNQNGLVFELADNGNTITRTGRTIGGANQATLIPSVPWAGQRHITVSPDEKWLFMGRLDNGGSGSWVRFNLATGAMEKTGITAVELEFGPDNTLYGYQKSYSDNTVNRYDVSGSPIAFQGGATSFQVAGNNHWSQGLTVADNGDIYVTSARWWDADTAAVNLYGPDGALKQRDVLRLVQGISVQRDRDGNLFVMDNVRPKGVFYPPDYLGQYPSSFFPFPFTYHHIWNVGILNYYLFHYGCIFKFPPSGGSLVRLDGQYATVPIGNLDGPVIPAAQVDCFYNDRINVSGPLWQYFGVGICSGNGPPAGDITCECRESRFSVDGYGRVLAPDAMHFSVIVLDNNKNEICRLGEYGNPDNLGEGSARPNPPIPFTYPMNVKAGGNNTIYVDDLGANRVLRIRLGYSAYWSSTSGIAVETGDGPRALFKPEVFPNPGKGRIRVRMGITQAQRAGLRVYDLNGRLVKSFPARRFPAGYAAFSWTGQDEKGRRVPPGMYFVRLEADGHVFVRPLMLIQ